jgi:hypothetical protein
MVFHHTLCYLQGYFNILFHHTNTKGGRKVRDRWRVVWNNFNILIPGGRTVRDRWRVVWGRVVRRRQNRGRRNRLDRAEERSSE